MPWIISKYFITAAVVILVSELAKRSDRIGGLGRKPQLFGSTMLSDTGSSAVRCNACCALSCMECAQWSELTVFLRDIDTPERFGLVAFSAQLINRSPVDFVTLSDSLLYSESQGHLVIQMVHSYRGEQRFIRLHVARHIAPQDSWSLFAMLQLILNDKFYH